MGSDLRLTRRGFLAGSLALASCGEKRGWTGGIVGAGHPAGHLLRGNLPAASPAAEKVDVIVVGSGMSGLIAAHRLKQAGRKVLVLELEPHTGGNAASGSNAVSAYPWGAHYVPVPNAEMTDVCALFREFGLGEPGAWREDVLCHDPEERLWFRGRWQEGLVPNHGVDAEEKAQISRFLARMDAFRRARGSDGRRAFAIPVDHSSADEAFRSLDRVTMAAWMAAEGFTSGELRWFVDYGCRDDYGCGVDVASAWAGVHYFASRDSSDVFTWPEGNGWLVAKLRAALGDSLRPGHLVTAITPEGVVDALDVTTRQPRRWQAEAVVCAVPRFIARRLVRELADSPVPDYAPWMTANLTLDAPISDHWDNVLRDSRSLGYVVATHQSLQPVPGPTVITYYQPLDALPPADARTAALAKSYDAWCEDILADLSRPHPDLRKNLRHLDVWLWGHAMPRPVPGALWGPDRLARRAPLGKVRFAHTDLSGLSIFEEACHWGHEAARALS